MRRQEMQLSSKTKHKTPRRFHPAPFTCLPVDTMAVVISKPACITKTKFVERTSSVVGI